MSGRLNNFLAAMPKEKYEMVVGTGNEDALRYGFPEKRVVHPGVNGKVVPPPLTEAKWQELMAGNPSTRKRMAYIHIPFCSHICLYCGFFQNYINEEREELYVASLLKELEMAKSNKLLQEKTLQCLFFGGGTPSALSAKNIAKILQKVREALPLSNDCEITLEARISDLEEEKMEAWFKNGINRISVGVQSFDTKVRQLSGRIDTQETIFERLKKISSYDQASIIVDIIFGLPGQTKESFLKDLEIIDSLPISGMDLYQLNLFSQSPMAKAIEKGKLPKVASRAEMAEMFLEAEKWLMERAYKRLSNCHWSKDIRERSMYNILAKTDAEIFPFGCGAGGFIGDYSMMLQRDLGKYMAAIEEGKKPIMFMSTTSPFDSIHKSINQNMEQGYLNFAALRRRKEELADLEILLDKWCQHGLMEKREALYFQTVAGRFWQNNLNQALLEVADYLLAGEIGNEVKGVFAGHPGK